LQAPPQESERQLGAEKRVRAHIADLTLGEEAVLDA
jgi:hypothetical protein